MFDSLVHVLVIMPQSLSACGRQSQTTGVIRLFQHLYLFRPATATALIFCEKTRPFRHENVPSVKFFLLLMSALSFATPPSHVSSFCFVRYSNQAKRRRSNPQPNETVRGGERKECKKQEKKGEGDVRWTQNGFFLRSQKCDSLQVIHTKQGICCFANRCLCRARGSVTNKQQNATFTKRR